MQYVSKEYNLGVLNNKGKLAYRFFNGVLAVGDLTTNVGAGNSIPAVFSTVDTDSNLMPVFPVDLAGAKTNMAQMAGLGTVDNTHYANARHFIEAPLMDAGDAVSGDAGVWYRVSVGYVTYDGVPYGPTLNNPYFKTDGTATTTTGTGKFHLSFPPDKCACYLPEHYRIAHLQHGDEATGYWNMANNGYDPRNQLTTADISIGAGWIR